MTFQNLNIFCSLDDTSKLDKWRVTYYVSILKKLGKKAISKVVRLSLS